MTVVCNGSVSTCEEVESRKWVQINLAEKVVDYKYLNERINLDFSRHYSCPVSFEDETISSANFSGEKTNSFQVFRQRGTTVSHLDWLLQDSQGGDVTTFMGIFSEINCVWLTLENRFYLWDYQSQDLIVKELDHVIISVGLISLPDSAIFQAWVEFLLVIATPFDISVFALCFLDPSTPFARPQHKLEESHCSSFELQPTPYYTPTDGLQLLNIRGLDGHILLGARNGSLYELVYSPREDTWGKNCWLKNLTLGFFGKIGHFLNFWKEEDQLIKIEASKLRGIVCTLSSRGVITAYSYENGEFLYVSRYDRFKKDVQGKIPELLSSNGCFELVDMFCVEHTETAYSNLVVSLNLITRSGLRACVQLIREFYNSVQFSFLFVPPLHPPPSVRLGRADGLIAADVPETLIGGSFLSNSLIANDGVASAFSRAGVWLVGKTTSVSRARLIGEGPERTVFQEYNELLAITQTYDPLENRLVERASVFILKHPAHTIHEIPAHVLNPLLGSVVSFLSDNEHVDQHLLPRRQFVVLNSEGINIYEKQRPIDELAFRLADCSGRPGAVSGFLRDFEPDESSYMLLVLACNFTIYDNDCETVDVRERAKKLFFKNTLLQLEEKKFSLRKRSLLFHVAYFCIVIFLFISIWSSGSFGADNNFSVAFHGLALYLSRLLRFVWNCQLLDISADTAAVVLPHLKLLKVFLEEHRLVWMRSFPSECRYWCGLHDLLIHSIEVLSLVKIIRRREPGGVALQTPNETPVELHSLELRSILIEESSWKATQKIIDKWLNTLSPEEMSLIREDLSHDCPLLFSGERYEAAVACELLKRAVSLPDGSLDRQKYIETAANACLELAFLSDFSPILVDLFAQLKQFDQLCQLCLRMAHFSDPENSAFHWFENIIKRSDVGLEEVFRLEVDFCTKIAPMSDQFVQRVNCYQLAYPYLQSDLPRWIHSPRGSEDALFQYYIFTRLLQDGPSSFRDHLLVFDPPHLQSFLELVYEKSLQRVESGQPDDIELAELVFIYYMKHKLFRESACRYLQLARCSGPVLIKKRVELMRQALFNATLVVSESSSTGQDAEFLSVVQGQLEVATIQLRMTYELSHRINVDAHVRQNQLLLLSHNLYDSTLLYNEFAQPHALYESLFSLLRCCNHVDTVLIKKLWQRLIAEYYKDHDLLQGSLKNLGKMFYGTPFFPVEDILQNLIEVVGPKNENLTTDVVMALYNDLHFDLEKVFEHLKVFAESNKSAVLKNIIETLSSGLKDLQ